MHKSVSARRGLSLFYRSLVIFAAALFSGASVDERPDNGCFFALWGPEANTS